MGWLFKLVREKGLEPSHLAALAPKASVSTISPLAHADYYIVKVQGIISKGLAHLWRAQNFHTLNKFKI